MIPAVDGLLDEPHNSMVLTLLYHLAEWHALAKLRMHTEHTLNYLEKSTKTLGNKLRKFHDTSVKSFKCQELPKETAARQCRKEQAQAKKATTMPPPSTVSHPTPKRDPPKKKTLNLFTYKFHALGDYVDTICLYGTTDSYSTQIVRFCLYLSDLGSFSDRVNLPIVSSSDSTPGQTKQTLLNISLSKNATIHAFNELEMLPKLITIKSTLTILDSLITTLYLLPPLISITI